MRRALREPLLHFLVFGLVVFGVDAALRGSVPGDETIVIDDALVEDLRRQQQQALERAPSEAEVKAAVARWIEEEILVREARARQLDLGDAQVRTRLAEKMAFLLNAREVPKPPDDAELRALYDAQKADFVVSGKLTLRQHFVAGADAKGQAEQMLARLKNGDAVQGDAPPGGPLLRGRRPKRLQELFGEAFVAGLDTVALEAWVLRPSSKGWHVVQVTRRSDARQLSFEEAKGRVLQRWRVAQVKAATQRTLSALRERYEVQGWPR